MGGEHSRRFGEGLEIAARSADGAQSADKLHANALLHFLRLAHQNAANLTGAAHVGSATGVQIKIADIDESQLVALSRRDFADTHCPRFIRRRKANLDRTIFRDDLVGQYFGRFQLLGSDCIGREIDGAALLAHVERNGRETVQPFEGRREHMLSGVLLHVIEAPLGVNGAAHNRPWL